MFVKTDKKTGQETTLSSTDMTLILERDINDNLVDDTLTEMVISGYEHGDRTSIYKYKA
ncbi:MAG: N-carbamoyl-L-amino acid amidohydrolase [Ghiorsea sp.]|nr:N-carbamoyl-L-amino acid amidohydrolase [Ghiorsea sp.]MDQ7058690.1 N-carbamoyl-L-amino acid amidohydrolase [Ghiorsea sp.]